MIHIVLDSCIYRDNPDRSNLSFNALERLSIAGVIKLHIPYIVEREHQTQQRTLCKKNLDKASSGLSGLLRKHLSQDILESINALNSSLNEQRESILTDAEQRLIEWANSIGANREPLCIDQAMEAMEAYFQGRPPLKSIKNRDDIPDSFIVRAIEKLSTDNGLIHVVSGDGKIRDSFIDNENIITHNTLSEFIESNIIQNELRELDLVENVDEFKTGIREYEVNTKDISLFIENNIEQSIVHEMIHDPSIINDNNDATITSCNEPENIEIDFDELYYYGSGQFGVPFSLNVIVDATYYIYKSDYFAMHEANEYIPPVSDHNDHYLDAEEEFVLEVHGTVKISIDLDELDFEHISEFTDYDATDIDEIESIELCK